MTYELTTPSQLAAVQNALNLAPGRVAGPTKGRQDSIVALGDSITTTLYGSHYNMGCMLAGGQLRNLKNGAVSGLTTQNILALFGATVLSNAPGFIYMMSGRNDEGTGGPASFATYFPRLLQISVESGARVILGIVPPKSDGSGFAANAANRAVMLAQAALYPNSVLVVDYQATMSSPVDGTAIYPSEWFNNIHPNAVGQTRMAGIWIAAMQAAGWLASTIHAYRANLQSDSNNLIPNGTFEAQAAGTVGMPTGWGNPYSSAQVVSTVAPASNRIGQAMQIVTAPGGAAGYFETSAIDISAYSGRTIALGLRMKMVNFQASNSTWSIDANVAGGYLTNLGNVQLDGTDLFLYVEYTVLDADTTLRLTIQPSANPSATLPTTIEMSEAVLYDTSGLTGFGKIVNGIRIVTTVATYPYTTTAYDDFVKCVTGASNQTVNLNTAVGIAGKRQTIKKTDAGIGQVVITPNGSQTIDGQATFTLRNQNDFIQVESDGSNWFIVSRSGSDTIVALTLTANGSFPVPAGYRIDSIDLGNTTANAVTGGIRIGTTSGATDVVVAQTVGASALTTVSDATLLKRYFSMVPTAAAQTLFVEAVTTWNSASVNLRAVLRKVY